MDNGAYEKYRQGDIPTDHGVSAVRNDTPYQPTAGQKTLKAKHPQPPNHQLLKVALRA